MNPEHRAVSSTAAGHGHDDQLDELFTVAELAALLRVPQATIRYWVHCGTGPDNFKIGRHVRYRRQDVSDWLNRQRRTGADGPDAA